MNKTPLERSVIVMMIGEEGGGLRLVWRMAAGQPNPAAAKMTKRKILIKNNKSHLTFWA